MSSVIGLIYRKRCDTENGLNYGPIGYIMIIILCHIIFVQ